jgi:hypothetical protein
VEVKVPVGVRVEVGELVKVKVGLGIIVKVNVGVPPTRKRIGRSPVCAVQAPPPFMLVDSFALDPCQLTSS